MKQPAFFIMSFLAMLSTFNGAGQDISISGFVDDMQGEPVTYANVLLMKAKDSIVLNGVSTDENGFFLLDNLSQDDYLVKFSFLGFKDVYQAVALTDNIDLGTIVLEEDSEMLDEVSIIARRPTLRKEADRMVFDIENTALIEGNMFQVLKSTPGILVLGNDIMVKNLTPTVYINQRKVQLKNDELVQLLEGSSANNIKSVEVITNPSAKYDADSGVVINIVMSKNFITGYRGNVFANYTQGIYPRYEVGMSHFFKSEKINFFANYTYSDTKIDRFQRDNINYLDTNNEIDQTFQSLTGRTTWSKTHNFNFNFDYSIDNNNMLSLSSNVLWLPSFDYKINNDTDVFDINRDLEFYYNANNLSSDTKYNLGFDMDYLHKFKKEGEQLAINTHYTTYNYTRDQNVASTYFNPDDSFLTSTAFRTDNNQDTEIFTAKADYSLPIEDASILGIGAKISNINTNSGITQFDIENGQETIDVNNTDNFDYNENIYAAYINYSKDWQKLSLVLGLRLEQTSLEGFSISNNSTNSQEYLEWFPSASLHYKFSDNFSLYTNYKRNIGRPDYQSLNPFQFFLNDFTIVSGNPNLQPVFINHAVIGTSFYKDIFTIEAYYKESDENIFQLPRQDNELNTLTYAFFNIDKTIEYGFDLLVNFNMTERWSVYFVTSFFNTKDEDVFDDIGVSRSQWSNYSILSQNFKFLKDQSLSASLLLTYAGRNIQSFTQSDELVLTEFSVSKNVLNKKGMVSLAISDLFNLQDFNTTIRYLNQNNASHINLDTRYIKLGFRYKFGNTRLTTNQRTKAQQETDRLKQSVN